MSRIEEIETFVDIARSGSITRAAERAGLAKSAASRRLADLEARLGVQLFVRSTRKLTLTDAGAAFLARAARILDDLADAETAASEGARTLSGTLRIAAPLSFGLLHLERVITAFMTRHPAVAVDVDFSDRKVDLVGEGFDVAVRIGVLADSTLVARRLCPIRSVAAASPAFWREHGRPRHPRDLKALPCLRYANLARPGVVGWWGPGGEEGAIEPPLRALANNGDLLRSLAEAGLGFLVEPTFFLSDAFSNGRLEPVLADYAWSNAQLHVVYPPTRQPSARVRAFADAVVEAFHENPYWDDALEAAPARRRKRSV